MGEQIKLTGMILNAKDAKESDKQMTVLTRERGKVYLYARGAKKQKSYNRAACEPFNFGEFTVYEGKSRSFTLMWANVTYHFEEVKKDLDLICYGSYFCEFAEFITRENNDEAQILKLLFATMRALEKKTVDPGLIRCVYEIRLMAEYGQAMEMGACVCCGCQKESYYFSSRRGGLLCRDCLPPGYESEKLEDATIYALQFILKSPLERLYTFKVSDQVLAQLKTISESFLREHLSHTFRSLAFLDGL